MMEELFGEEEEEEHQPIAHNIDQPVFNIPTQIRPQQKVI